MPSWWRVRSTEGRLGEATHRSCDIAADSGKANCLYCHMGDGVSPEVLVEGVAAGGVSAGR